MNFRKALIIVGFMLAWGMGMFRSAQAQTAMEDYEGQVHKDLNTITNYVNGPFIEGLGFFTSLGWNTTPTVYNLATGPHFQFGVGIGADFIPLPNLGNLSLPVVSASGSLSLPSGVPIPYPVMTAHLGLFSGFDVGARYSYLPPINASGVSGGFTGWGLQARYKFFDGPGLPTVTMSTSFDSMTGSFLVNTPNFSQTGIDYYDANNSTNYPNASLSGNSNYTLSWATQTVGTQLMVGKNLGIFYPFVAIGIQRNSGTVTSTLNGSFTGNLGSGPFNFNSTAVSSGAPVILEPKYVLGFNLGGGFGIDWLVVGESNGIDIAGTTSLSLEF